MNRNEEERRGILRNEEEWKGMKRNEKEWWGMKRNEEEWRGMKGNKEGCHFFIQSFNYKWVEDFVVNQIYELIIST